MILWIVLGTVPTTYVSSVTISSGEKVPAVAPNAKLGIYKFFGLSSATTEDIILAVMLKAYEEGPDIMTLSLGDDHEFSTIPIAVIASRMALDTVAMLAAGDSVTLVSFMFPPVAYVVDVLSIGSAHGTQIPALKAVLSLSSGKRIVFGYSSNMMTEFHTGGRLAVNVVDVNGCA